jgi:triacylglycerol lipase
VATPYRTGFLSGRTVTNITLQRQCSTDEIDHVALTYDSVALHDVLNALDPGHATRPRCKVVLPLIGG